MRRTSGRHEETGNVTGNQSAAGLMMKMRDEVDAAIQRYQAMFGLLQGVPEKVERQGEEDRKRYGDKYLALDDDGDPAWHPLPIIRFLVEVCGIPFRESREAVMEDARATGVGEGGGPVISAEEQARKLLAKFGDIFEAREYAKFLAELLTDEKSRGKYWRDVLACVETIAFVPEDTGLENWE